MSLRVFSWRKQTIPRQSVVFISVGVLLAAIPMLGKLPILIPVLLLVAAFGRMVAERWLGQWAIWALGLIVFLVGMSATVMTYNTIVGLEPGAAIMLVLLSLKVLETKSSRDFRVLALLGYFLCVMALFFSQDFPLCLYVAFVFTLLTAALVHLHLASWHPRKQTWPALRLAMTLLAQSLPLTIVLFLIFPRFEGVFRFQLGTQQFNKTGMSDEMKPGSISNIAVSNDIAFRVDFLGNAIPSSTMMYWRGAVLWQDEGLAWQRGLGQVGEWTREPLAGELITQRITLEPHGSKWLFALDRPEPSKGLIYRVGGVLESPKPVLTPLRYDVTSRTENHQTVLSPRILKLALSTPALSPEVKGLVDSWRQRSASDREVISAALHFFRKEHFVYTLSPGGYKDDSLDEFLFHRKFGFCEHYAAAFATLMRAANIPSRVVLGYLGGQYNSIGGYVIVPQSDAHAWCEVWLRGQGWIRVDPTTVVAPERVSSGLESFLKSASTAAATNARNSSSTGAVDLREILHEAQLAWDTANYQWNLRVLGYDEQGQRSVLTIAGLENIRGLGLLFRAAIAIALLLHFLAGWMHLRSRARRDKVSILYQKFCERLAGAGMIRHKWEGPLEFALRASARFPAHAEAIEEIRDEYIALRYGGDSKGEKSVREFAAAVRKLSLADDR